MTRCSIELVVALVVAALAAWGVVEGSTYRGQSSYAPIAVTGLMAICALAWAGQNALALLRSDRSTFDVDRETLLKFTFVVVTGFVFVLAVTYMGFFTSTAVMVPMLSWLLGYRKWFITLVGTACFLLVLFAVFSLLLRIPLPRESLLILVGVI